MDDERIKARLREAEQAGDVCRGTQYSHALVWARAYPSLTLGAPSLRDCLQVWSRGEDPESIGRFLAGAHSYAECMVEFDEGDARDWRCTRTDVWVTMDRL